MDKLKKMLDSSIPSNLKRLGLKEALESNRILREIGILLNKKIPENAVFLEKVVISPSDRKTPQIVISASHDILQIVDEFLLKHNIIALKEHNILRIDLR
ncbi:MAG: hypothetical protein IJ690_06890 [Clostridia bacterium]|nr:hypothetical protein [Clostridia bacterium]